MRNAWLVFLIPAVLLTPWNSLIDMDFATSVVPGWHTPILPVYAVIGISFLASLYAIAFIYFIFQHHGMYFSKTFFVFHCLLTFPLYFLYETTFLTVIMMYVAGQIAFICYCFAFFFQKAKAKTD